MKKMTKLKVCDWCLLMLTVAIIISGIQLETTHSSGTLSVWLHIITGMMFFGMSAYHIFLHFGNRNWFAKFRKQKNQVTRILWWVWLITLISGITAMTHWTMTFTHAPIGGIHGKLGFLMILLSICHITKRIKFFTRKKKISPNSI